MKLYTKHEFGKDLSKHKNRILIRNGEFVGLYKYIPERWLVVLTKKLNDRIYGFCKSFHVRYEGDYWGAGGFKGIGTLISCNEAQLIPFGYDLRRKKHLEILNQCLGGCNSHVSRKIENANPNKINQRSVEIGLYGIRLKNID